MPPWNNDPLQYCPSQLLSSDDVFCDPKIIHFWMVSLGLALLFWGLLTVATLLPLFHSGHHEQAVAGEVLRRLLIQMGLLVLTACSFYLLEVVNQGEFYLIDALTPLHSATGVCVDCLWKGPVADMITQVHDLIQNQGTDDIFQTLSGGQWTFAPTDSPTAGLFGQSWGQLIGGLATFAATFSTLGPAVRYVVLVLAVGSAPFALMAAGHRATRALFSLWLHLWGELVVLAFLSALVVAGWHAISDQVSYQLDAQTSAYVGLAALGILGGMNLAYIMRIMGSFLQTTSGFYQANFQRESSTIWGAIKLGAAVVGTAVGVGAAVGGGTAALGGEATAGAAGGPTPGSGGPAGEANGFTPTLGTPGSAAPGDAWQEWSPTSTGNTTGGSDVAANATSSASAPGRQGGAARQTQRALPATPTGRLRGIATVLAHSRLPVISEAAGPLAAGLSYTHQAEREQQADWRYAVGQAEATRRELKADWRYAAGQAEAARRELKADERYAAGQTEATRREFKADERYAASQVAAVWRERKADERYQEGKTERAQARAESDQRHAAQSAYSLWRQKEAALREAERKAESDQRSAASSAYSLWRQKEAALRDTARKAEQAEQKAEADQRSAASSAYGLLRQKEAALREAERKAEKEARSQTWESF